MSASPEDRLLKRLRAGGLAHRADAVVAIAAPCVWLDSRREEDHAIPVGASKLGGMPDLPAGVEWPVWREQPMAFIAQIRLDEAARYDDEGILPATGLLSIFFATDGEPKGNADDDDPTSWRVTHLDGDPGTFSRRIAPTHLAEGSRFQAAAMTCSRWITLPHVNSPECEPVLLTSEERTAYIELATYFHANERGALFGTYLLGHPVALTGSALSHGYRITHGLPYPGAGVLPGLLGWRKRKRMVAQLTEMERAAAREWRLLFQTDGGDCQMDWAGGGMLHVTIPREALTQRDFSRAWMSLDFV